MSEISLSELLTDKQKEVWRILKDRKTTETLYGGAAGGGKSFIGALWLHLNALRYPGTRWLMGRSELKTLKETTLQTYFEVLKMLKHSAQASYNERRGVIKYANGSLILLADLKYYPSKDRNFDRLGSLELTGAFVDEANQIVDRAREVISSRVRYKLDEFDLTPKTLYTCNPAKNWTYKDFYKPDREGKLEQSRAFVRALVTDNQHISPHYVENLRNMKSKSLRARLLHGFWEYDDDPYALCEYDSIVSVFTNDHVEAKGRRYLTCDIAFRGSDKFVIVAWVGWVAVECLVIAKCGGKEVLEHIKSMKIKHRVQATNIIYDADGAGGFIGGKGGFIEAAVSFHNGARPLEAPETGELEQYENLKTQCYFRLARRINKGEVYLACFESEEQERVIEELEQIKERPSDSEKTLYLQKKSVTKDYLGRSPDIADALMMRVHPELGKKLVQP